MIEELAILIREFGPLTSFLIYYVWDSRKQRAAMAKRLDAQTEFTQGALTKLTVKCEKTVSANTSIMTKLLTKLEKENKT